MGAGSSAKVAADKARAIKSAAKRKASGVIQSLSGSSQKASRYNGESSSPCNKPSFGIQAAAVQSFCDTLASQHDINLTPAVKLQLIKDLHTSAVLPSEEANESDVIGQVPHIVFGSWSNSPKFWEAFLNLVLVMDNTTNHVTHSLNDLSVSQQPAFQLDSSTGDIGTDQTEEVRARRGSGYDVGDERIPNSDFVLRDWLMILRCIVFFHTSLGGTGRSMRPLADQLSEVQRVAIGEVLSTIFPLVAKELPSSLMQVYDVMDILIQGQVFCSHTILPPLAMPNPVLVAAFPRSLERAIMERICTYQIPFLTRSFGLILATMPLYRLQEDILEHNVLSQYIELLSDDDTDLETKFAILTVLEAILPSCPGLWENVCEHHANLITWMLNTVNQTSSPYRLRVLVATVLGCSPALTQHCVALLRPMITLCEHALAQVRSTHRDGRHPCAVAIEITYVLRGLALLGQTSPYARRHLLGSGVFHDVEDLLQAFPQREYRDRCSCHVVTHELVWSQLYYLVSSLYRQSFPNPGAIDSLVQPPPDLFLSDASRASLSAAVQTRHLFAEYYLLPVIAEASWVADGTLSREISSVLSNQAVFDNVLRAHAPNFLSPYLWRDLVRLEGLGVAKLSDSFRARLLLPHTAEVTADVMSARIEALAQLTRDLHTPARDDIPREVYDVMHDALWSKEPLIGQIAMDFLAWAGDRAQGLSIPPSPSGHVHPACDIGETLPPSSEVLHQLVADSERIILAGDGHDGECDVFAHRVDQLKEMLRRPDFCIAVCGAFNSGKSTLVNTLCALDGRESIAIPSHWLECTAMLVEVVHGRPPSSPCLIFSPDTSGSDILAILYEFERSEQFVDTSLVAAIRERACLHPSDALDPLPLTQSQCKSLLDVQVACPERQILGRFCDAVRLFSDAALLEGGIRMVDCPGTQKNADRTALTQKFITEQADIVVLATPSVGGWLSEDYEFAAQMKSLGKPVVIVNSKFDQAIESVPASTARDLILSQQGVPSQSANSDAVFFTSIKQSLAGPSSRDDLPGLRQYLKGAASNEKATIRARKVATGLRQMLEVYLSSQVFTLDSLLALPSDEIQQMSADVDRHVSTFVASRDKLNEKVRASLENFESSIEDLVKTRLHEIVASIHENWLSLARAPNPETHLRKKFIHELLTSLQEPVMACVDGYCREISTHVGAHETTARDVLEALNTVLHPIFEQDRQMQRGAREEPLAIPTGTNAPCATDDVVSKLLEIATTSSHSPDQIVPISASSSPEVAVNTDLVVHDRNLWHHPVRTRTKQEALSAVWNFVISDEGLSAAADAKGYFDVVFSSMASAALPVVVRACIATSAAVAGTLAFKIVPKLKAVRSGTIAMFQADLLSSLGHVGPRISRGLYLDPAQSMIQAHNDRLEHAISQVVRPLQIAKAQLHSRISGAEELAARQQILKQKALFIWTQCGAVQSRLDGPSPTDEQTPGRSANAITIDQAKLTAQSVLQTVPRASGEDNTEGPSAMNISPEHDRRKESHLAFQHFLHQQEERLQNDDWTYLAQRLAMIRDSDGLAARSSDSDMSALSQQHRLSFPPIVLSMAELCLVISDASERLQRWNFLTRARLMRSSSGFIEKRLAALGYSLRHLCPSWSGNGHASPIQRVHSAIPSAQPTLPWYVCQKESEASTSFVIVISGTKRLRDLFISAQCLPTQYVYNSADNASISVHSGIYLAARAVWQELLDAGVITLSGEGTPAATDSMSGQRITFTGHSVGGAVATLLAMFAQNEAESSLIVDAVYAFGPPRFLHSNDGIASIDGDVIANLDCHKVHVIVHPRDIVPSLFGSSNLRLAVALWQQLSTMGAGLPAFLRVCANYQPVGRLHVVPEEANSTTLAMGERDRLASVYQANDLVTQRRELELRPRHLSPAGIKSHFMEAYVKYVQDCLI